MNQEWELVETLVKTGSPVELRSAVSVHVIDCLVFITRILKSVCMVHIHVAGV